MISRIHEIILFIFFIKFIPSHMYISKKQLQYTHKQLLRRKYEQFAAHNDIKWGP